MYWALEPDIYIYTLIALRGKVHGVFCLWTADIDIVGSVVFIEVLLLRLNDRVHIGLREQSMQRNRLLSRLLVLLENLKIELVDVIDFLDVPNNIFPHMLRI